MRPLGVRSRPVTWQRVDVVYGQQQLAAAIRAVEVSTAVEIQLHRATGVTTYRFNYLEGVPDQVRGLPRPWRSRTPYRTPSQIADSRLSKLAQRVLKLPKELFE